MIIQNANVLNCESLRFEQRELYIENGIITDRLPEDRQVLDAGGAFVIPGFIDTHIHGFCNCDFGTPGTDLTPARLALVLSLCPMCLL